MAPPEPLPAPLPVPPLPAAFFGRDTATVARELLGALLVRRVDGGWLAARVVETEAYLGAEDRASHAWGGRRTPRNAALYLAPGHAYVYFIYGMHFCLNVVANPDGRGGAVLFRAAEVLAGGERVREHRGLAGRPVGPGALLGGPGRLCQGLAVDRRFDGHPLADGDLRLLASGQSPATGVDVGPRVGIAYAGDAATWPLRFALRGHPEVSRPRVR